MDDIVRQMKSIAKTIGTIRDNTLSVTTTLGSANDSISSAHRSPNTTPQFLDDVKGLFAPPLPTETNLSPIRSSLKLPATALQALKNQGSPRTTNGRPSSERLRSSSNGSSSSTTGEDGDYSYQDSVVFKEALLQQEKIHLDQCLLPYHVLKNVWRGTVNTTIAKLTKTQRLPAGDYFFHFFNRDMRTSIRLYACCTVSALNDSTNKKQLWQVEGKHVRVLPQTSYTWTFSSQIDFSLDMSLHLVGKFIKAAQFEFNIYKESCRRRTISNGAKGTIREVVDLNPNTPSSAVDLHEDDESLYEDDKDSSPTQKSDDEKLCYRKKKES